MQPVGSYRGISQQRHKFLVSNRCEIPLVLRKFVVLSCLKSVNNFPAVIKSIFIILLNIEVRKKLLSSEGKAVDILGSLDYFEG